MVLAVSKVLKMKISVEVIIIYRGIKYGCILLFDFRNCK